jgi:hypothetical protein
MGLELPSLAYLAGALMIELAQISVRLLVGKSEATTLNSIQFFPFAVTFASLNCQGGV